MATGQIITKNGLKIALNRTFKSSPDYTAPSQFKVGTGTTTPASTDTDAETAVTIDADVWKNLVTGYPSLDETNLQATMRGYLNTIEANGNSISEFCIFNSDDTELMYSRSVITPITKTTSVEVSIVQKDRFKQQA